MVVAVYLLAGLLWSLIGLRRWVGFIDSQAKPRFWVELFVAVASGPMVWASLVIVFVLMAVKAGKGSGKK